VKTASRVEGETIF